MVAPLYIGDELTAIGYRLAGARVRIPVDEDPAELLVEGCRESPLVLLGSAFAKRVPRKTLHTALSTVPPLVLIVPDAGSNAPIEDLSSWFESELGID